jgi:hypothetical protein
MVSLLNQLKNKYILISVQSYEDLEIKNSGGIINRVLRIIGLNSGETSAASIAALIAAL